VVFRQKYPKTIADRDVDLAVVRKRIPASPVFSFEPVVRPANSRLGRTGLLK
jgi:hypothetical protein